jgi:esterase/lipase
MLEARPILFSLIHVFKFSLIQSLIPNVVSEERLQEIRDNKELNILVVTGTWDNLVRPENSYYLAKVLCAKLEIFQDSGHVLITDSRDRFNSLLVQHFESTQPSSN